MNIYTHIKQLDYFQKKELGLELIHFDEEYYHSWRFVWNHSESITIASYQFNTSFGTMVQIADDLEPTEEEKEFYYAENEL